MLRPTRMERKGAMGVAFRIGVFPGGVFRDGFFPHHRGPSMVFKAAEFKARSAGNSVQAARFRSRLDALAMMEETQIAHRVERLLEAPIGQAGYRLLEVQFRHEGRWVLRLIVDREPGISMEGLTDVNELAGRLLDVEDPIPQAYSLEVSSPGLFRPLREIKHFRQSVGKWAVFTLAPDAPNAPKTRGGRKKRQLRGVIRGVDGETVQLEYEGKRISLAKDEIQEAKLDPDL